MDKKEILEKSQKENRVSDERDRQIEQKACTAGYRAVAGVNCLLCLLLILQEKLIGEAYDLILGLIALIPPILTIFMFLKRGF